MLIPEKQIDIITRQVCERYGLSLEQLREHTRGLYMVQARLELCYLLHQTKIYSFKKIGKHLNRDHSTVYNNVHAYAKSLNKPKCKECGRTL